MSVVMISAVDVAGTNGKFVDTVIGLLVVMMILGAAVWVVLVVVVIIIIIEVVVVVFVVVIVVDFGINGSRAKQA